MFNILPNCLVVTIESPLSSLNSSDTDSSRQAETRTNKQKHSEADKLFILKTGGFRN